MQETDWIQWRRCDGDHLEVEAQHQSESAEAAARTDLLRVHRLLRIHRPQLLHLLQLHTAGRRVRHMAQGRRGYERCDGERTEEGSEQGEGKEEERMREGEDERRKG